MSDRSLPKLDHNRPSEFWIKTVGYLQDNWAVFEKVENGGYRLYFFDVQKAVFDSLDYKSDILMKKELMANGFERYEREAIPIQEPTGDFHVSESAHRKIYSSGKFWKSMPARIREKYGE